MAQKLRNDLSVRYGAALADGLMGKTELAGFLGIKSRTLARWMHDPDVGMPPPMYIRARPMWRRAAIRKWLEGNIGKPTHKADVTKMLAGKARWLAEHANTAPAQEETASAA